ncbi:S-layer homology domain-containing protein [Metabacillus litoralis]|uniref:S-layer homology domain-containing protein n=1 Tax=Metabacillus litoralis TaxID=152268 RepID=A0A5C6VA06_9BACI|nr:S-layer homology domain-containing protein [Metabacillus litoralis]TXC81574.1 S-layer homology domain-containing protein [Metabacillus litoralis]
MYEGQAAYTHVKRILAVGITAGFPDGTYRSNDIVTRASYSAFLARALNDTFKVEIPNSKDLDVNFLDVLDKEIVR